MFFHAWRWKGCLWEGRVYFTRALHGGLAWARSKYHGHVMYCCTFSYGLLTPLSFVHSLKLYPLLRKKGQRFLIQDGWMTGVAMDEWD